MNILVRLWCMYAEFLDHWICIYSLQEILPNSFVKWLNHFTLPSTMYRNSTYSKCSPTRYFSYFFKIYFTDIQLIYNVMLVSAVQQSDSVIHLHTCVYIYIYIYTHTFSYSFPLWFIIQYFEYSSMCYTVGPCCLSILYIIVCIS